MTPSEQAEADRHLGELVRALYTRRHYLSMENMLDGGAAVAWGTSKHRATGEDRRGDDALDEAVGQAAFDAGIMARAKTIPPRAEMPTVTDYKALRGPT